MKDRSVKDVKGKSTIRISPLYFSKRTIIVRPRTQRELIPAAAQVTGANASDFSVRTTCSKLWAKSACKVNVVFKPTAPGTRTATVVVTDSAVGSPHQITVTGTGRHRK